MTELDEERRHDLAQVLGEVARSLQAEGDENQTLSGIVTAAVATVPGVVSGGISQVHRRQVLPQMPSDELVTLCDRAQNELGEGPCLDAIWTQQTVIVDDFASETRWPAFAARAAELGAGSLVSFQLYVQDDTLGALNLYGGTGVRFGDEAQLVGEVFATHAALALAGARHSRQLNEALASRDAIGQAKGLLAPALCPPPYKPERVRTAIGTRGHRSGRRTGRASDLLASGRLAVDHRHQPDSTQQSGQSSGVLKQPGPLNAPRGGQQRNRSPLLARRVSLRLSAGPGRRRGTHRALHAEHQLCAA